MHQDSRIIQWLGKVMSTFFITNITLQGLRCPCLVASTTYSYVTWYNMQCRFHLIMLLKPAIVAPSSLHHLSKSQ